MISFLLCVLYRPPHLVQIKTSFGFLQSAKVLFGSFPTNINEKKVILVYLDAKELCLHFAMEKLKSKTNCLC